MTWTPAIGTGALLEWLGPEASRETLIELLTGDVTGSDLIWSDRREVLLHIGDGHARRLMVDGTGDRLAYWPKVWAARALAYLGDRNAVDSLVAGVSDEHWRVRMTCIQALGRLGADGVTSVLAAGLDDEHRRVREAAVIALGRVGDERALQLLARSSPRDVGVRRLDAALRRIEGREIE